MRSFRACHGRPRRWRRYLAANGGKRKYLYWIEYKIIRESLFSSCLCPCRLHADSPALLRTTPDRRPPGRQPSFNMHRTGVLPAIASSEEDAPRSRGIIRKSNMNPKNIGSYMEGKDEEGEAEGHFSDVKAL